VPSGPDTYQCRDIAKLLDLAADCRLVPAVTGFEIDDDKAALGGNVQSPQILAEFQPREGAPFIARFRQRDNGNASGDGHGLFGLLPRPWSAAFITATVKSSFQ